MTLLMRCDPIIWVKIMTFTRCALPETCVTVLSQKSNGFRSQSLRKKGHICQYCRDRISSGEARPQLRSDPSGYRTPGGGSSRVATTRSQHRSPGAAAPGQQVCGRNSRRHSPGDSIAGRSPRAAPGPRVAAYSRFCGIGIPHTPSISGSPGLQLRYSSGPFLSTTTGKAAAKPAAISRSTSGRGSNSA
jgi:hypothetical protein